jgi:DNA-binding XRE family transcriptional regulator
MPKKVTFTDEQIETLFAVLEKAAKDKKRFKNQEALALAVGLTQPSLSALLRHKWRPGVTTARAIANLAGETLEDMIGPLDGPDAERPSTGALAVAFANLETCIRFYSGTKSWSPWTIAAARSGFFGETDFPAPSWPEKLDGLEQCLAKLRAARSR